MKDNYIGENIKIYRERRKLTQQELADKIGKTWEMISRYERGLSSPMNQLTTLADALDIHPALLLKEHTDISTNNRIPLFVEIPKSFTKKDTFHFYSAPDWIIQNDEDSFIIDSKIIERNNVPDFENKGYLYISPNNEIKEDDFILVSSSDKLLIEKFKNYSKKQKSKDEIIGKIVAQEIRL
ncbi:MAG: helix-turn-helix domain-containing protein [Candidatus Dojkabacteria bacterium]|jgi:transcriptional regulator with XRE-family HTH domain